MRIGRLFHFSSLVLIMASGAVAVEATSEAFQCLQAAGNKYDPALPEGIEGVGICEIDPQSAQAICADALVSENTPSDLKPLLSSTFGRALRADNDTEGAMNFFRQAQSEGHKFSLIQLGLAHLETKPKKQAEAVELFKQACGFGLIVGCYNLAAADDSISEDQKLSLFEKACFEGDGRWGCNYIATEYENSPSTQTPLSRIVELNQRACDAGNPDGCYNVRFYAMDNDSEFHDPTLADEMYIKARNLLTKRCTCDKASPDHSVYCETLADLYFFGSAGIEPDYNKAQYTYGQLCYDGHPESCFSAGQIYKDGGYGVSKDPELAAEYYSAGCEQDEFRSCVNLGQLHENRQISGWSLGEAKQMYQRGCELGAELGCDNLSKLMQKQ